MLFAHEMSQLDMVLLFINMLHGHSFTIKL